MNMKWIAVFLLSAILIGGVTAYTLGKPIRTTTYRPEKTHFAFYGKAVEVAGTSERVKCLFSGSETPQSCSTDRATCTGKTTCTATVKGKNGDVLTWKSSCGGYGKTTINGHDKTVTFDCKVMVKERVQCFFKGGNPKKAQTCSSALGKCTGIGTCFAEFVAYKGTSAVWTSTCNGNSVTKVGANEKQIAKFDCGPVLFTKGTQISEEATAAPSRN